jgi:hypothetical protein
MHPFLEPLESRRLMSAGALCTSSAINQPTTASALIGRAAATAQVSLLGTWSGTYDSADFGSGDLEITITRQKGNTVKGSITIDGHTYSGSAKLAATDVDAGAFNLSFKRGRIAATLTGTLSADAVNGSVTFKYGRFGAYDATFQLQKTS